MINIRHLLVAHAVLEHGSVSAAARRLRVSQPSITKTLKLAEQELGIALFERVAGRLQPTSEALLMLPEVKRLAGFVGTLQDLADQIRGGRIGKIAMATNSTLANSVLAEAAAALRRQWPAVTIEIMAYATKDAIERVALNAVDFGITDVPVNDADLRIASLCEAEVVCVLPDGHRLAARDKVDVSDLVEEPILAFSEETRLGGALLETFRERAPRFQFAGTVNQSTVACALVERGAGIALIDPFPVLAGAYRDLTIRRLTPRLAISPVIIRRIDRPPSRFAIAFEAELRKTLAGLAETTDFVRATNP